MKLLTQDDELNINDAAAIVGVHRITIHRWCKRGYLKCHRRQGIMFPLFAAVLALAKRRQRIAQLKAQAAR